jgi:hypothetical protein
MNAQKQFRPVPAGIKPQFPLGLFAPNAPSIAEIGENRSQPDFQQQQRGLQDAASVISMSHTNRHVMDSMKDSVKRAIDKAVGQPDPPEDDSPLASSFAGSSFVFTEGAHPEVRRALLLTKDEIISSFKQEQEAPVERRSSVPFGNRYPVTRILKSTHEQSPPSPPPPSTPSPDPEPEEPEEPSSPPLWGPLASITQQQLEELHRLFRIQRLSILQATETATKRWRAQLSRAVKVSYLVLF